MNINKLKEKAIIPTYGTEYSAGFDLYACLDENVILKPYETKLIPMGIAIEIPTGYAGLVYARSGLATKEGLAPANKVGVIDSDYRGEILVPIYNQSNEIRTIEHGKRIAQMIITPYLKVEFNEVDELNNTIRGVSGFGSTGEK